MSDAKTLKINGTDFTSYIPPTGYEVGTKHVYGNNKMTMANGVEFKDEIANLAIVTVPFMPLTSAQQSTLMQTLLANPTCTLYYFDPDINDYRTIVANRSVGSRKYKGMGADSNYYFGGPVVTFEETA